MRRRPIPSPKELCLCPPAYAATAASRPSPTRSPRTRTRQRGHGPRISGLTVSDAPTVLTQEQALAGLGLDGNEFAEGIFERSGVKRRHLNLSEEFMARTLRGRTEQIERELMAHAINAVEQLQIDPLQIGTVISASLYSLGCPTLAHRLVDHFEMGPDDRQVPHHRRRLRQRRAADAPGRSGAARAPRQAGARRRRREHERDPHAPPRRRHARPRSSARRSSATAAPPPCSPTTHARPDRSSSPRRCTRSPARSARSRWSSATKKATCSSSASCPISPARGLAASSTASCATITAELGHRPLDRPPGRPADHRERTGCAAALQRGRRDELACAGRARQRRHAVDLLRAQGHDRARRAGARRARADGHDRARRDRRADAARLVSARPPLTIVCGRCAPQRSSP